MDNRLVKVTFLDTYVEVTPQKYDLIVTNPTFLQLFQPFIETRSREALQRLF